MSASIATDLFAVLEKQIGKTAAAAAMSAYLAGSAAPHDGSVKVHKPWSEETKARAAEKRAATKAAGGAPSPVKAAAAAPAAVAAPAAEAAPAHKMSDELKAKMKAGREAAAARKKAAEAAGAAPEAPPAAPSPPSDGHESSSSGAKKRGPKPLAEMTPEERAAHDLKVAQRREAKQAEKAAAVPLPASPEKQDHTVFAEWSHDGKKYLRNMRGDVLTPECDWVGRFNGKTIDRGVKKPADLEDE